MTGTHGSVQERISARLTVDENTGCHIWTGANNGHGYGQAHNPNGSRLVHRALWEAVNGPLEDGFELDHLCRNRACANLEHLQPVTHSVNILRGKRTIDAAIEASASNRRALTHCTNGHEFTPENTYIRQREAGGRACRKCLRAAQSKYRERVHASL